MRTAAQRVVKMSRELSRFFARPACIAGVRIAAEQPLRAGAPPVRTEDRTQERARHVAAQARIGSEALAETPGNREQPLVHGDEGQNVVGGTAMTPSFAARGTVR